jgi:hypothetical protein
MLVCTQPAVADEAVDKDAVDMEIIEMLGEIEDDTGDLELAMSDDGLDDLPTKQEVKNAK